MDAPLGCWRKMKKIFCLITCCLLILSSCKKKNETIISENSSSIEKNESINKIETVEEKIVNDIDPKEEIRQAIISKEFIQRWSIPNTESDDAEL